MGSENSKPTVLSRSLAIVWIGVVLALVLGVVLQGLEVWFK